MARRMHSTDPDAPDPYEGVPSRADKQSKQHEITAELAALGLALAELSPAVRAKLELPDGLEQAIYELSNASRGARVRQRRFVARQLRGYDAEALAHAVGLLDPSSPVSLARGRLIERWRDRMLSSSGGDEACEEFLAAYPSAARQPLRQMVRAAGKEGADADSDAEGQANKGKKGKSASAKRRALYQYLREHIAEADPRPTAPRAVADQDQDAWDDADADDPDSQDSQDDADDADD